MWHNRSLKTRITERSGFFPDEFQNIFFSCHDWKESPPTFIDLLNKMYKYLQVLVFIIVTVVISQFECKKSLKEEDCEVCVNVVKQFEDQAPKELYDASTEEIEKAFMKFCEDKTGKEDRFCYYIGGSKISATYILGTLARPFKYHMPPLKICEKLREIDPQICELKYEKKIDFTTVDFKKLKVKDLKKILSDWGEERACKGCSEKSDFVRVVKELLPKYAPEAAAKLKSEL